jgi:5-methylcytosine-specific restriction endonuclease McrA
MINCPVCQTETNNPKFCSRSCAARQNNVTSPKRKPESSCVSCGVPSSTSRKYCKKCWIGKRSVNRLQLFTIESLAVAGFQSRRKYQVSSQIRDLARAAMERSGADYACSHCGYRKHVNVCHIRAIKDFLPTDLVSEVNSLDNLIYLCPNCHWEFDHPSI